LSLPDGTIVAALVAVNSFGSAVGGGPHEHGVVDLPKPGFAGANTTIAAVATNAVMDKAGCTRLALMAQDGFARALRPIHTPFDGDTVFALSTGAHAPDLDKGVAMAVLGTLAADCVVRAIEKAIAASNP
jgi:L-aminopeptidase/D-esterase-like protein